MARGLFVTFEGPEGAGKSTAVATLAAELRSRGHEVLTTREPGAGAFGAKVRALLLEGGEVEPSAELFLFLADRAQHVATIIRPALLGGTVVLCDRFADSTLAYQGYGRGWDLDWLRRLNATATGGLTPDLKLLFDLSSEEGLARLEQRDRIDAESLEFHHRVREGFRAEAAADPLKWTVLNAANTPEAVAHEALNAILSRLARPKVAILVGPKGRGSNMRALIQASTSGELEAQVAVVISPVGDSPAATFARASGTPVAVVAPGEDYGARLLQVLRTENVAWVCLAGFTRLLPVEVLDAFAGHVLNIHPALLPKFGGKGMYGRHVHEAVLAAGEAESGATVHLVTHEYDEGPIVLQARCPVLPTDTPETLAARVLELEHRLYPAALQRLIEAARG